MQNTCATKQWQMWSDSAAAWRLWRRRNATELAEALRAKRAAAAACAKAEGIAPTGTGDATTRPNRLFAIEWGE
eukprot:3285422-Pyramimonas_sp.AAC.1